LRQWRVLNEFAVDAARTFARCLARLRVNDAGATQLVHRVALRNAVGVLGAA
jgi:hypothetical protein